MPHGFSLGFAKTSSSPTIYSTVALTCHRRNVEAPAEQDLRGHDLKLHHHSFRLLRRKAAFSAMLPTSWNSPPTEMVNSPHAWHFQATPGLSMVSPYSFAFFDSHAPQIYIWQGLRCPTEPLYSINMFDLMAYRGGLQHTSYPNAINTTTRYKTSNKSVFALQISMQFWTSCSLVLALPYFFQNQFLDQATNDGEKKWSRNGYHLEFLNDVPCEAFIKSRQTWIESARAQKWKKNFGCHDVHLIQKLAQCALSEGFE